MEIITHLEKELRLTKNDPITGIKYYHVKELESKLDNICIKIEHVNQRMNEREYNIFEYSANFKIDIFLIIVGYFMLYLEATEFNIFLLTLIAIFLANDLVNIIMYLNGKADLMRIQKLRYIMSKPMMSTNKISDARQHLINNRFDEYKKIMYDTQSIWNIVKNLDNKQIYYMSISEIEKVFSL